MKKWKKLGNWLRKAPKWTEKYRLSSKDPEVCLSNARSVGKKTGQDVWLNILLYDSCFVCPLSVYIDVVCDDNLNALVIEGNPTNELLEDTKLKLMSEFSEMSNQAEMKMQIDRMRNLYLYEIQIRGFELALALISRKMYPEAIEFLNQNGLKCKAPETEEEFEKLTKAIQIKIMNRISKYKEAKAACDLYQKKGEKPTRKYFNKLLVMLSVCEIIKFQLDTKKMTVAEFAEYLNLYNEYQNNLKSTQYGRKF